MKTLRSIFTIAVAAVLPASAGLQGAGLAQWIADNYRPAAITDLTISWWSDTSERLYIAPKDWWDEMPDDAYNRLGAPGALVEAVTNCIPGPVTVVTSEGEGWHAGLGSIAGLETAMWQPDASRCGDLARRLMYIATVYPQKLWHGRGAMIFADGGWPLFQDTYINILLEWHRADPVDATEIAENTAIEAQTGNSNPFVTNPDFAEYLWGEKAADEYVIGQQPAEIPVVALKAIYSINADVYFDAISPIIPTDAVIYIDEVEQTATRIPLDEIGVGQHELNFTSPSTTGKMLFTVTK